MLSGHHPGLEKRFVCSVCMVRILCAVFGQVQHENGVPPLVLCNARPFARLQCFLFWAFPDFRPFLGPLKTPFPRLWEMSILLNAACGGSSRCASRDPCADQRFLRETLAGGWYGLTNLTSMEAYPDYYGALLFTRYANTPTRWFRMREGSS